MWAMIEKFRMNFRSKTIGRVHTLGIGRHSPKNRIRAYGIERLRGCAASRLTRRIQADAGRPDKRIRPATRRRAAGGHRTKDPQPITIKEFAYANRMRL